MSPIYDYYCECGNEWEAFHSIEDRLNEICACGKKASRKLTLSSRPVVYEYFSENLNAHITGPKQKQRILREKNISEVA